MNAHLPLVLSSAYAPLIESRSVVHTVLSEEDRLQADRAINRAKTVKTAQQMHDEIQHQQQMLRILGGAL